MKTLRKTIIVIASIAMINAGCGSDSTNNQQTSAANLEAELTATNYSLDSVKNVYAQTLKEIDSSMDKLFNKNKKEQLSHSKIEYLSKQDILNNINIAGSVLEQNKKKISQLRAQLTKMKIENAGLNQKLADYDKAIALYEEQLALVRTEIMDKDIQIADLNKSIDKLKLESLMNKRFADKFEDDLNTAYYTEGTSKQLKKSGVLVKKGGILGLGSTEILNQNFPEQLFAKIDIRETKSIPVNAKNVKLITEHPDNSYELKDSAGLVAFLEIKNPTEFWKISKHMVLEIRN